MARGRVGMVLGTVLSLLLTGGAVPALAGTQSRVAAHASSAFGSPAVTDPGGLTQQNLAKAAADECFNGIGNPYPLGPPCTTGQPKVNQSYVWGLTRSYNTLWFGTATNVQCLVEGTYLQVTTPQQNSQYVCEFGKSQYATGHIPVGHPVPAGIGDWRPPHIYTFDLTSGQLTDKSSLLGTGMTARLNYTVGIRSAAAIGNTVFLAGPSFGNSGQSIDVYAFNAISGTPLGVWNLAQYNDIRKWVVVNGVLYAAVGNVSGGGSLLRWTGSLSATGTGPLNTLNPASPLFTVVGTLNDDAAEVTLYNGNIYVGTWPTAITDPYAGLWMSPAVGPGGLTTADAGNWKEVWSVDKYEPDPVTAHTYGMGSMTSYGGSLYWGTMHVPLVATLAHIQVYGTPSGTEQTVLDVAGTWRAIALFNGQNFGASGQTVNVLYGEQQLPAYTPGPGWAFQPTSTGTPYYGTQNPTPLYGHSGFGNPFNNYTWSMAVYNNQLFVGTMDWSFVLQDLLQSISPTLGPGLQNFSPTTLAQVNTALSGLPNAKSDLSLYGTLSQFSVGGDLWRFPAPGQPAIPVSTDGLGNTANYGFRTMIGSSDGLYIGTANPMNLDPKGGWELIKLSAAYTICNVQESTSTDRGAPHTMTISLQLCDANGNNVSSPAIIVHAVNANSDFTYVRNTTVFNGIARVYVAPHYTLTFNPQNVNAHTLQVTVTGDIITHTIPINGPFNGQ